MKKLVVLFAFATSVLLSPALHAQSEPAINDMDGGWHEAVIVASDLERMKAFFEDVAGWETIASGRLSRNTSRYLTGKRHKGRYAVIKPTDFNQGWVRIIELEGVDQEIIRSNAQAWDSGGIFSIMARSANIERNLDDAEKAGWTAFNDPYDFGFGNLQLRNIVFRGPDGVNVAVYEWVQPKREDAPPEGMISKVFNSMQMVADLEASKAFYADALGFKTLQEGAFLDKKQKPTNFALPINYSTEIERDYAIYIPEGANDAAGRLELMHFRGFQGRDLSDRASLSNLGIVTLMFPVSSLDGVKTYLETRGIPLYRDEAKINIPPFGKARAVTIRSPEGALLTFFDLES